jgi:phosphate uptake regulator
MTGGSSFVITLPKEWANSLKIKKNDPLGLITKPDGTLLITPKITGEQTQKIKEFEVSDRTKQAYLIRQLIGAYIEGYTVIKIKSSKRVSPSVVATTRKFTEIAIGQEVVEETNTSITIKDLLNPVEMPFSSTIKRMHIIVKSMHEDTMRALETSNKSLAEEVKIRDNDVDRLHWLIARQHNTILQNISLAEKMNITIGMSSTCFLISRIIERIGDHVVRIAQNIINLSNSKLNQETIDHIQSTGNLALEIFNKSIESFFRKNIQAANENIERVSKLEKLCQEINKLASKQEPATVISLGYIVESIRRIGEYAEDISETVINHLIGEGK